MFESAVSRLEQAFTWISSIALFFMMIVIFVDVGLRYLFDAPFSWSHDVITLYLGPMIFFLGLAHSVKLSSHISVDILKRQTGNRSRAALDVLACVLTLVVFFAIAATAALRAYSAWENGDVIAGEYAWPMWLSVMIVPVGVAAAMGRFALMLADALRRLVNGAPMPDRADELPEIGDP